MNRYLIYAAAGLLVILGLRAVLPHRLEETRSTEVLGLLNAELRGRPAGVALADLTSFAWDEACALSPGRPADDLRAYAGLALPEKLELVGEGWLLVFAKGGLVQAATRVPPSYGGLDQREPVLCVNDTKAFLAVREDQGTIGLARRFALRE